MPAGALRHPPGILAPQDPVQVTLSGAEPWSRGPYQITPLARFEIAARVLAKKRYRSDREADLSNYDLALGWGPMSDQCVLDELKISQGDRWYRYRYSSPPIPQGEITRHSANMHIIAGNAQVTATLAAVVPGQVVEISGYLIMARAQDGWVWTSSLTRSDAGAHSCEVVWAEKLTIRDVRRPI